MLNWLRDHFVPHHGNDHKPHFLRSESIALVLLFTLVVEGTYLYGAFSLFPESKFLAQVISTLLVDQTNNERSTNGELGKLTVSPVLVEAAQHKANDMAAKGYFSHNTPDGKEPWFFLNEVGYTYDAAGENLAVNFTESTDVTRAWMNSPGHRANILNGRYTEVGIATAQGKYKGSDAIFVVQFFGKPKSTLLAGDFQFVQPAFAATTTAGTTDDVRREGTSSQKIGSLFKGKKDVRKFTSTTSRVFASSTSPTSTKRISLDSSSERVLIAGAAGDQQVSDTVSEQQLTLAERAFSSPRSIATTIFMVIAVVDLIALICLFVFKWRIKHPRLAINGVLLFILVVLLLLGNFLLAGAFGTI